MSGWVLYQHRLIEVRGEELLAYDFGKINGKEASVVGANAVYCPKCKQAAPDACKTQAGQRSQNPHVERVFAMTRKIKELKMQANAHLN